MIKRILVGLGGTLYSEAKVAHAVDLALRHEAELTGVTIVDAARIAQVGSIPVGGGPAAHELREYRERAVREHLEEAVAAFKQQCEESGVHYRIIHETGDPFDDLVSLWRYHDLTLLGLQGFFEYDVLDAPDDRIVKLIARGVRPIIATAKEYHDVRRALIAYDGSMEAAKAMKRFVQMRLWDVREALIASFDLPEEKSHTLLRDARDYFAVHGIDADTFASTQDVRHGLLEFARDWRADIVVMGSTSRGRLARFILGDTVLHMIRHADIPLFLAQ